MLMVAGLSRMTYETTQVPASAVTDALMDDNFVNAVDLGMRESEFNSWLIQLRPSAMPVSAT